MFAIFAEKVRRAATEMQEVHRVPLRLVVVDTMVASFGFPEDPGASTVTKAMKQLDSLAQELDVLVVAIHHAGKSRQAGEHGSYAWRGSAETSIEVAADRDEALGAVKQRRLVLHKNRHGGGEGWNAAFDLQTVGLGFDEDGDEITSCVVEPTWNLMPSVADGMTDRERRFMEAFEAAQGQLYPILTPDGEMLGVPYLEVRARHAASAPGRSEDAMRKQCDRGRADAVRSGRIKIVMLGTTQWLYANPLPEPGNDNATSCAFCA